MTQEAAPDALKLDGDWAPERGYEIVPTDEAVALVAYLLSLKSDVPLFEAPFTAPASPAPDAAADASANP